MIGQAGKHMFAESTVTVPSVSYDFRPPPPSFTECSFPSFRSFFLLIARSFCCLPYSNPSLLEIHSKHGFLSNSTAEGLRVTLQSTVDLVDYLSAKCGFTYIITSRLSQDKLENLFGIVRQFNGCNDHPTPAQFLVTVNALAFYNLAKPPKTGNCNAEIVNALLGISRTSEKPTQLLSNPIDELDRLVDEGRLEDVEATLNSLPSDDHRYVTRHSSSRLIAYIAGYVARKFMKKSKCSTCSAYLISSKSCAAQKEENQFISNFDHGGLLYPSSELAKLVHTLEESFTVVFLVQERLTQIACVNLLCFCKAQRFPSLVALLMTKK